MRDTRIPADLSPSLMELLVGRCCYPWQWGIFESKGLEWKGQYFFCNQGASLIYFFRVLQGVSGCDGQNSQRRVIGKEGIQWPGKAGFLWSLPAVPLHPWNLPSDPSEAFFGEDTTLYIQSCDANRFHGMLWALFETAEKGRGWAGSCQNLQKTTFPASFQMIPRVSPNPNLCFLSPLLRITELELSK